jgi:flagellar hook assembly protein FlgD
VDVEIYDVRGAMVRRLAGRIMDSGWHTLDWDGRDETGWSAGAGVYFVRMAAGGRRLTVRLALVR